MLLDPFEEASKDDTLVTDQPRRTIDRMRVAALDLEVGLATGYEETAGFVKAIEALEVEETTIHDVEGAGLGQQLIEDVDLVHLAITDVNEGGDVAAQIEQRMQLDGCVGRANTAHGNTDRHRSIVVVSSA